MPSILPVSPVMINVPRVFLFPICYGIVYLDLNTIGFLAFQTRLFSLVVCCFIYLYLRLKQSKYSDLELNTWRLYYHDWAVFNFHFYWHHIDLFPVMEKTLLSWKVSCVSFVHSRVYVGMFSSLMQYCITLALPCGPLHSINSDCLVQLRASSYLWNLKKRYHVTEN